MNSKTDRTNRDGSINPSSITKPASVSKTATDSGGQNDDGVSGDDYYKSGANLAPTKPATPDFASATSTQQGTEDYYGGSNNVVPTSNVSRKSAKKTAKRAPLAIAKHLNRDGGKKVQKDKSKPAVGLFEDTITKKGKKDSKHLKAKTSVGSSGNGNP